MMRWLTNGAICIEHISYVVFTYDRVSYADAKIISCTVYLQGGQTIIIQNKQDCEIIYQAIKAHFEKEGM